MTDRHIAYTVVLEREIRADDAEHVIAAIGMIKGVAEVIPVVATPEAYWARSTARQELIAKLFALLREERSPKRDG